MTKVTNKMKGVRIDKKHLPTEITYNYAEYSLCPFQTDHPNNETFLIQILTHATEILANNFLETQDMEIIAEHKIWTTNELLVNIFSQNK